MEINSTMPAFCTRLEGLETMNQDKQKARVVYAKIREDEDKPLLDQATETLTTALIDSSVVDEEELLRQRVFTKGLRGTTKLGIKHHMTVLNAKFAGRKDSEGRLVSHPFDARPIFANGQCASFDFGTQPILKWELFKRERSTDGSYKKEFQVQFAKSFLSSSATPFEVSS
eukprot:TRINITY_DN1500_c0_g2_i2.p2 TRINITY_DN1500_c0_g2~~TRINITY_DN1500_c0_g2_i2.p2  ORF type:complete len:171 (-),score=38.78 TRINITY_DN1500_c0_g2_i2:170-682(-)